MIEEVRKVAGSGDRQRGALRLLHGDLDVAPARREVVRGVADSAGHVAPHEGVGGDALRGPAFWGRLSLRFAFLIKFGTSAVASGRAVLFGLGGHRRLHG